MSYLKNLTNENEIISTYTAFELKNNIKLKLKIEKNYQPLSQKIIKQT